MSIGRLTLNLKSNALRVRKCRGYYHAAHSTLQCGLFSYSGVGGVISCPVVLQEREFYLVLFVGGGDFCLLVKHLEISRGLLCRSRLLLLLGVTFF